jgi:arylsulfatase A-like enzyme
VRPNIVLILADDLGAAELGCYGNTKNLTPNLDRLATEGMRFETCWATPVCTPSRVMLLTGQYGQRNGYRSNAQQGFTPPRSSPLYDVGSKLTFADLAVAEGYATALAGKWQLTGKLPSLVRDCGFDAYRIWARTKDLPEGVSHASEGPTPYYWRPCILENGRFVETEEEDYGPDWFNDFAIQFIKASANRPFLLFYSMCLPHPPWGPTPKVEDTTKKSRGGLRANLKYLDHLVGKILNALQEAGVAEKTLVIFTADNGTAGDGKTTVTPRGVRVPLIVRYPGSVAAHQTSLALASLADVFPTVARLTGATVPENHVVDGTSLDRVLRGEEEFHRDWCYSFHWDRELIRTKDWLLDGAGRLYDCEGHRDPVDYQNVTKVNTPRVEQARKRLRELIEALQISE